MKNLIAVLLLIGVGTQLPGCAITTNLPDNQVENNHEVAQQDAKYMASIAGDAKQYLRKASNLTFVYHENRIICTDPLGLDSILIWVAKMDSVNLGKTEYAAMHYVLRSVAEGSGGLPPLTSDLIMIKDTSLQWIVSNVTLGRTELGLDQVRKEMLNKIIKGRLVNVSEASRWVGSVTSVIPLPKQEGLQIYEVLNRNTQLKRPVLLQIGPMYRSVAYKGK